MNTKQPDPDAQLARWQRFRNSRNTALASEYGWLTLTSFQWLEDRPAAVELVPGLWSTDGTTAFLTAGRGGGTDPRGDRRARGRHHQRGAGQ